MTRDCRCHRLFYPYFINSHSANSVNTLKTKTTISPVRKNCELYPRWRLPKTNLAINQLLSQPVCVRKRTLPHGLSESAGFDPVDALFGQASQSIHLDSNTIMMRSPRKANALKPQQHYSKRRQSELNLSRVSSDSGTLRNDQMGLEMSKNSYGSAHDSFLHLQQKNYDDLGNRGFHGSNWQATLIQKDRDLICFSPPTEVAQIIEDHEQLIFKMSPFTTSHGSVLSMTDFSDDLNSLDGLNTMDNQKDDPGDDDDDEDERSISITSVLPIDIPQPLKSL